MMKIALIRNAATRSELEGRFLGLTDEPLSLQGRRELARRAEAGRYPPAQLVFTGVVLRCLETAQLIYPNKPAITLNELRPCDYGDFEGMTYDEIVADKRFEAFAAANRLAAIAGSREAPYEFLTRCGQAFRRVVREAAQKHVDQVGMVVDQSILQTILRRFCAPRTPYRDWSADFGGGYLCEYNPGTMTLRALKEI